MLLSDLDDTTHRAVLEQCRQRKGEEKKRHARLTQDAKREKDGTRWKREMKEREKRKEEYSGGLRWS